MCAYHFMLNWMVLSVLRGFGLALALASDLALVSLEAGPGLLLTTDGQTASFLDLKRLPGVFGPDGEGEEVADQETSSWEGGSSSIAFNEDSSIFSHPLPSSLFDEDSGSNDFFPFDLVSDCSTSKSLLPVPLSAASAGKSRARRRRGDNLKSCDNPSSLSVPANIFPMTTNSPPPHSSSNDDKNDPLLPLAGGAGMLLLGVAFFSECAAMTTYALPAIYCNIGTKDGVRYNGKRDFQFRGKFDTWSLVNYQKGRLISIIEVVRWTTFYWVVTFLLVGVSIEFLILRPNLLRTFFCFFLDDYGYID